MEIQKAQLFQMHAAFCRVLANPKRLMILDCLKKGEMSVGKIAKTIGAPLSTVSQHLTILRDRHVVESRKEGQTVYYRPVDLRLMGACEIIRAVLIDGLKARGEFARKVVSESTPPVNDSPVGRNSK